jgi:simple sugar transport system ATP-binding protein
MNVGFSAGSQYTAELRNISKVYPGSKKKANSDISIDLRKGEILCIAGENGAGKTTLMKILCGLEAPSGGEVYIRGKAARIDSPLAAKRLGIGMVHQHFMLFPEYTVAENIVMGIEPRKWGLFFDKAKARTVATEVIQAHHFSIKPDSPVHSLGVGEMQQVEICRILYRDADIIILDEPSSVLTGQETASLFKTLKALAATGKSLIIITHKLREIKQVSDRVAVLRKGELVGIRNTAEIDEFEISRMMIGADELNGVIRRQNKNQPPLYPGAAEGPVIAFENVTVLRRGQQQPLLDRVSFGVRCGEIVGFAGVGGNGLGVLEAVLGGFLHPASGKITHNDRDISRLNIRRLRNQGLAYVPANRRHVGSVLNATVDENIIAGRRREFSRMGFFDTRAIRNFSDALIRRYSINVDGAESASVLSGGNLQKLILSREIDQFRDYMVFSEPTWGLDIAASGFVWGEISALCEKGAAIILISTNLDEILNLADRIIVMYRGRIAGEFLNPVEGADTEPRGLSSIKEAIGACMQGLPHEGNVPQ